MKTADAVKALARITTCLAKMRKTYEENKRRAVCKEIHVKQFEETDKSVVESLAPVFEEGVRSAASRLSELSLDKSFGTKSAEDQASNLAEQIFNPSEWEEAVINAALPPLAKMTANAMLSELLVLGFDPRRKSNRVSEKATTATEWLAEQDDVDLADVEFSTPSGPVTLGFLTEFPGWMKDSVESNVREMFKQSFWRDVNRTTQGDIGKFLLQGLERGESIDAIARNMAPELIETGRYAIRRARTIARTETGHALNGARTAAVNGLKERIGDRIPMRREWLSVLGPTTRDSHAHLDGVPEDKDGTWELGGVKARWPADIVLPVQERANCQCTVSTRFGIEDEEAEQLIAEGQQRLEALEAERFRESVVDRATESFEEARDRDEEVSRRLSEQLIRERVELDDGVVKAIDSYTGGAHTEVNKRLRGESFGTAIINGDAEEFKRLTEDRLKSLDDELSQISPRLGGNYQGLQEAAKAKLDEPTIVFRGLSNERLGELILENLETGDEFTGTGFVSTTTRPTISENFARRGSGDRIFIMETKARTGVAIDDLSDLTGEREVIQAHGTRYRFLGSEEVQQRGVRPITYLRFEEIEDGGFN